MLAPAIGLAAPDHVVAGLLPVADGGVAPGGRVEGHRPEVEVHRLTRLQIGDVGRERHAAIGRPVVLPVGHDRVVGGQRHPRLQLAGRHFQLVGDRIRLDVHAPRGQGVLLVEHGGSAQVDQRVAAPVEIAQAADREPVALVPAAVERTVGPAVAQPDGRERPVQIGGGVAGVLGDGFGDRVIGPRGVVLHVPDLVPEPVEAAQPVEIEPGLPAEGTAAHHAQDDEHARATQPTAPSGRPRPWTRPRAAARDRSTPRAGPSAHRGGPAR